MPISMRQVQCHELMQLVKYKQLVNRRDGFWKGAPCMFSLLACFGPWDHPDNPGVPERSQGSESSDQS